MRIALVVLVLSAIAAAGPVGLEPVVRTGADGADHVYYRINTGTGVIDDFAAPVSAPPRCPADTGVLWVDRNHRDAHGAPFPCAAASMVPDGGGRW